MLGKKCDPGNSILLGCKVAVVANIGTDYKMYPANAVTPAAHGPGGPKGKVMGSGDGGTMVINQVRQLDFKFTSKVLIFEGNAEEKLVNSNMTVL